MTSTIGEGATVAFERQHVAALLSQARERLDAIDAAQRKIDAGVYEICDICGGPIGAERLAARPAALSPGPAPASAARPNERPDSGLSIGAAGGDSAGFG